MNTPVAPILEWRIHIGAHKTATTHLQKTLAESRVTLLAGGVDYLPLVTIRPILSRTISRRRWQYWTLGAPMRRAIETAILPVRQGASRVVLSEENLLGSVYEAFSVPPYHYLDHHLARINTLAAGAPLTIYLSIRSFDRIVPGAYATALRSAVATPDELARTLAAFCRAKPPSWVDFIERMRQAAPDARFRVWRQEDYAKNGREILADFVGLPDFEPPDMPNPASTATPSDRALREIEALARGWRRRPKGPRRKDWTKRVDEIAAAFPVGPDAPRFNPLDADRITALQRLYDADCAEIAARWPEMCLLWGEKG